MKSLFKLLLLFIFSIAFGQKKDIFIDLESSILTYSEVIESGKYDITLLKFSDNNSYEISISQTNQKVEPLTLPSGNESDEIVTMTDRTAYPKFITTINLKINNS